MTTPTPMYEPESPVEELEEKAADAGLVAGAGLRAIELVPVVLVGLLVVPPLAILAAVVVVPLLVMALVLGVLFAVISAPYLLVHHFRAEDSRHMSLLAHRLRHAGRALVDLLPHRIVADARRLHHTGR
jgi:hypothetical protein